MAYLKAKIVAGVQWLAHGIVRFGRGLPEVRAFTGPESARARPGERVLFINGKVIVIPAPPKMRPHDGIATPANPASRR